MPWGCRENLILISNLYNDRPPEETRSRAGKKEEDMEDIYTAEQAKTLLTADASFVCSIAIKFSAGCRSPLSP